MRTHFDVLGIRPAFHVDAKELEVRFLNLSKQFHPDRFAKAPPRERLEALQKSTELNDAYKVLKHEVKRAEYLLKLEGYDVADERGSVKADPALLMDMMERNEALAEAKAAGDEAKVAELAARSEGERAETLRTVDEKFRAYEAGDRSVLPEIAQALVALRYHARFLEQAAGEEAL